MKAAQTKVLKKDARIVAELTDNAPKLTPQIAEKSGVTAETIRRDIEESTERRMISRTYGG